MYDKKKNEYAITTSDIVFSGLQLSLTYFSSLLDSENLRENRRFKKLGLWKRRCMGTMELITPGYGLRFQYIPVTYIYSFRLVCSVIILRLYFWQICLELNRLP